MEILGVDILSAAGGALASAATLGIRSVLIAPVKAATERATLIKGLSFLFPQKPYSGSWKVTWWVDSNRFQPENTDTVRIYAVAGNVTFTTTTTMLDGSLERCVFVGRLKDRMLTGRWYDPKDEGRGYYGVFQLTMHGTLRDGAGYWSGWTSDGRVQSNRMAVCKTS